MDDDERNNLIKHADGDLLDLERAESELMNKNTEVPSTPNPQTTVHVNGLPSIENEQFERIVLQLDDINRLN